MKRCSTSLVIAAAAAAKFLQSCPTLCNHMDCSLPGSSVHGIFQARVLEWGAIAFSITCHSVQFSSVPQSCPTLCDPMNRSTPDLPVHHHLLEFAQVHVHCIGDAIQPSYPLTPSASSALNLSHHQGLFQWVGCSHQMTKILEFQLQHQSFQWAFRVDFPWDWLVWSCYPRDFQESSPAPQFKGINPLALCLLYSPALKTVHDHWKDHSLDLSKWIVKK